MGTAKSPDRVRTVIEEVVHAHIVQALPSDQLSQEEWDTIFFRVFDRMPDGYNDPAWDTLLDSYAYGALTLVHECFTQHH